MEFLFHGESVRTYDIPGIRRMSLSKLGGGLNHIDSTQGPP